ncbi:FGGY family carbohydrate kinase [Muricauda sp. SCSIO 64092]|uniref:xylulokinase n=1 Tax=Allomuricauda sp. SCSIO 64092 TaxID=2908842 RepID=UPI001FF6F148|nr:FGGY family carbohydrate kinase [Muricauda sp. SCSIO 64092]UOY08322.1 FGGY family carbohydrate kinase [Muricauda sp. SCSIO 64092]
MYFIGLDIGSSSVKVALVEQDTGKCIGVVLEPEEEMSMYAQQKGWAEQKPQDWWACVCQGIKKIKQAHTISKNDIVGIGISYQMHGLVVVDAQGDPLRKSIIWCDSRAVDIGNRAFRGIGEDYCKNHLLNSPANFTLSKLKWVQENEPETFAKIHKFMLPGDYIAYCLSGTINTTVPGLSEAILWDFKAKKVSSQVLDYFQIDRALLPEVVETFSQQSTVSKEGALESGLLEGTPILYRAGDQPNNALSLNVFHPGEVAATGGTSGVVYAVTDNLVVNEYERVNNFAHVNYGKNGVHHIGKLLCINGAGIQYRWLMNNLSVASYEEMNQLAAEVEVGSDGVCLIPFGNGAERMLGNKDVGTRLVNVDLNRHSKAQLCRAALEGIAFSFVYGIEIMKRDGIATKCIRAGNDNLFRSEIFANTIATLIGKEIEIYNTTGAVGAARACILANGNYSEFESYMKNDHVMTFMPFRDKTPYQSAYENWKKELELIIDN